MELRKFCLKRDVYAEEIPWLGFGLAKGMTLFEYPDMYGCCSEGILVTLTKWKTPFFELPKDVLIENTHQFEFSDN